MPPNNFPDALLMAKTTEFGPCCNDDEYRFLWNTIMDLDHQDGDGCLIEIGAHCGSSTSIIASAGALRGWLTLVFDPWCTYGQPGIDEDIRIEKWIKTKLFLNSWIDHGRKCGTYPGWTIPILGDSVRNGSVLSNLGMKRANMVFIDGGHIYPQPLLDIETFSPILRIGGIMIIHDMPREDIVRSINDGIDPGMWTTIRGNTDQLRLMAFRKDRE